jgi:geranylgeranyl diphosphate synthase type II
MMTREAFDREYAETRAIADAELGRYFACVPKSALTESMRYSVMAGGKRIRPVIVLQFCKAAGGGMAKAAPAAAAVELLHTYSLIHDDLPCMDDDALRRGKPTNHIVLGECIATLAGDALQAEAFGLLLGSDLPAGRVVTMGALLAKAAGIGGICLGQALDMDSPSRALTYEEISGIHALKTSSMLVASAQIGVAAAGGSEMQMKAASDYAQALGLAFQIRDDVLDVTGSTDELGKPAGSDASNDKSTFVTLFGVDECERIIREKTCQAVSALAGRFGNTDFLETLASYLEERKY